MSMILYFQKRRFETAFYIWACEPKGCGRLFIETSSHGHEIMGTYYDPIKNILNNSGVKNV